MVKDNNLNKRNILVSFLVIMAFIFLAVLSELIYITNNDPKFLRKVILEKSITEAKNNSQDKALKYLFISAGLRINNQVRSYPKILSKDEYNLISKAILSTEYDKSPYIDYIKSIDLKTVFETKDIDFLRIFYNLALIADQNNYYNDVLPFLKSAMYLEPQLSHAHIEVANYYLLTNRLHDAQKVIEQCKTLTSPSYHCSQYDQTQVSDIPVSNVGFLKDGIDQQYP